LTEQCNLKNEVCGGRCTGFEGAQAWKNRRIAIDKDVDCKSCNEEAHLMETFSHDLVNVRLGKKTHDKKNFHKFVEIVNCAAATCKEKGTC